MSCHRCKGIFCPVLSSCTGQGRQQWGSEQLVRGENLRGSNCPDQTLRRMAGDEHAVKQGEGQRTCFAISTHSSSFLSGTVLLQCAVSASTASGMSASCVRAVPRVW